MHERTIVQTLIEQIDEELRRRMLAGLAEVRLEIGEFSGIEPALLELAFEEMAAVHWQRDVILDLQIVPLIARCHHCRSEFPVERFRFVCPACQGTAVEIIKGEELRLISLRVEVNRALEEVPS